MPGSLWSLQPESCRSLTPAQGLENVNSSVFLDTVRECFSVYQYGFIDTDIDMPAQRPMFIEHVIGKARGNLVDSVQNLGNRACRHRNFFVSQIRKEPEKMLCHFDVRHDVQPNRTEYTGGKLLPRHCHVSPRSSDR